MGAINKQTIGRNLPAVLSRIRRYEKKYSRSENSVQLLAISKTRPVQMITEGFTLGQCQFGENYVQEAEKKINLLHKLNIVWHFTGPIQSNKAKKIAALFSWVHSVDRISVAKKLSDNRPLTTQPLNVCVQVNLSGESAKSGVPVDSVYSIADSVKALPQLRLRGLMAIPAPQKDFALQRRVFSVLRSIYENMKEDYCLDTLSMGMSDDFESAIAEGATMVRLGTAIFGPRNTA